MKKSLSTGFMLVSLVLSSCQSLFRESHVTPAPTPQCVEPSLTLGTTTFRIDTVTQKANRLPEVPKKKDVAFWVEGTTVNYVFVLSPTAENLALNTVLKIGDPALINWADCSKDEFVINSIDESAPKNANILDQSAGGITVYVGGNSSTLVIHGGRPVVQPAESALPEPTNQFQFDLTLLDQSSPDATTVKIGFAIDNTGTQSIKLTEQDISLTVGSAPEIFPTVIEPALPHEIQPGNSLTVYVTFPKPEESSAVIRVLDTTFDYYFQ